MMLESTPSHISKSNANHIIVLATVRARHTLNARTATMAKVRQVPSWLQYHQSMALILSHLGTATVNCYVVSGDQVTDYNANITAAIGATYV